MDECAIAVFTKILKGLIHGCISWILICFRYAKLNLNLI